MHIRKVDKHEEMERRFFRVSSIFASSMDYFGNVSVLANIRVLEKGGLS